MNRYRWALALILSLLSLVTRGESRCASLTGAEKDDCLVQEYSRNRLVSGSPDDLEARGAVGYRAPVAETDGRGGAFLVKCGDTRDACHKKCGQPDDACHKSCELQYGLCSGTELISPQAGVVNSIQTAVSPGGPPELPDTYKIEFDDNIKKAP